MSDDVVQWLQFSDEDLRSAASLLQEGRYRPVGTFCQQAIEKRLKAVIVHRTGRIPPRSHDLLDLAELAGFECEEAIERFLAGLTRDYLDGRYPRVDGVFPLCTDWAQARRTLTATREVLEWPDQLLK